MSMQTRLILIAAILGATLAVQQALIAHMRGGAELEYAHLRKSIADFPLTFTRSEALAAPAKSSEWLGMINPTEADERAKLPFTPDALLYRTYWMKKNPSVALGVYMVHSRQADDRKHHPEVCVRDVTGAKEDLSSRAILFVDAEQKRPIQRFRFKPSSTKHQTVYYWHYTLPRVPRAGETPLQVIYQRINTPAPSITVQVWLEAETERDAVEKEFLVFLDQALRDQYLPEGTVMACDRIPIALQTRE
jgi:hypothetical protein